MIAPAVGAALVQGVGGLLSGLFSGNKQDALNKQAIAEQQREYNLTGWQGAEKSAETAALRDKLLAIFGQVASQGPQTFRPRDAFNPTGQNSLGQPTAPSQGNTTGAMNPAQLNLPSTYKMGDGGVNPDVSTWLLNQLGYRAPGTPERLKAQADDAKRLADYQASLTKQPGQSVGGGGGGGMVGGYNPYGQGWGDYGQKPGMGPIPQNPWGR